MNVRRPLITLALASAMLAGGVIPALQSGARSASAAGLPPGSTLAQLRRLVTLPGSLVPRLATAHRLAQLQSNRTMSVALSLKVRDQAGLDQLLHNLYNRTSPDYKHFLTPQEFKARFAPTAEQEGQLETWLQSQGLHVVKHFANGLQLTVQGTVGRVESAFGTSLYTYKRGSQSFFANATAVHVPAAFVGDVAAVSGLTNSLRPRPDTVRIDRSRLHAPAKDLSAATPQDLATLYDLSPLYKQGYSGNGQTIALFEFADFQNANISGFDSQFSVTGGGVQRVPVSDGSHTGASLNDGESECELDIEVVQAVAPAANILVYEGADDGTDASWISTWDQIVSDNKAQVISTSWTLPEWDWPPSVMWAIHAAIEEAAVQGQTVFSSTKDHGAYADTQHPNDLSVGYPGSDPWVTGVGGTMLFQDNSGNVGEAAWSEPDNTKERVGGGGGLSIVWARPDYQQGPGVQEQASNGARQVPDVAALAGYPGYSTLVADKGKTGQWVAEGGTSASAPLWASYLILVEQVANGRLGFMNPYWYALGQKASSFQNPPFYDVTVGDNLYYKAGPGWDFASGWGSMDGYNLALDLGTMGAVQYPTPDTIFSVDGAAAAKKSGSRVTPVSSVKRNQTAYLAGWISLYRLPGATPSHWKLTLSTTSGHAVVSKTFNTTFPASAQGKQYTVWVKIKVPKSLKPGKYVATAEVVIGNQDEYESSGVRVR